MLLRVFNLAFTAFATLASLATLSVGDECHLTPVIHVLQYPGCIPKPIPSFACAGKCTSYVQVRQEWKDYSSYNLNYYCSLSNGLA